MPRREPPRQPPPVQRLRLRYSKLGVARFASHRDFSRAFERALRRAEIPMAYSSGFSPHPRISYANAAPTSAASHAEYLDIALAQRCDPAQLRDGLNDAMPHGFQIHEVVEHHEPSLTELLQASDWVIDLGTSVDLESATEALIARDEILVHRTTKKGDRVFNARSAVMQIRVDDAQIIVRLRHGTPLVRPDDIVSALREVHPGLGGDHPGLFTRLAQGPIMPDGSVGDPLDPALYQ